MFYEFDFLGKHLQFWKILVLFIFQNSISQSVNLIFLEFLIQNNTVEQSLCRSYCIFKVLISHHRHLILPPSFALYAKSTIIYSTYNFHEILSFSHFIGLAGL